MAKTVCKILGVVFLLVGLLGFVQPDFLGAHLSRAHNVVHIVSGAIALYLGFAGTLAAAKTFFLFLVSFILRLVFSDWHSVRAPTACGCWDHFILARSTTAFTSCWE